MSTVSNDAPELAWLNGKIISWDACVIHARSQAAFWGANVFEGVRAYWNPDHEQLYLYRLDDHLRRLRASMKCLNMPVTYDDAELRGAVLALLRESNTRQDTHIVFVTGFNFGTNFDSLGYTEDTLTHITALPMPRSPRYESGVSVAVSSWRRISDETSPPRIKTGANYHNSRLAQHEAVRNGHDTALFLNQRGTLAEAPGCCVAVVLGNEIVTPPGTSGVLEGITLDTMGRLASERLGLTFQRREIDRTELYLADEAMLCGTLAELQPIIRVDGVDIGTGKPGPILRELQQLYDQEVRTGGQSTPVYPATETHVEDKPLTLEAGQ
ncbi:branched chain amino acid aminotransferase [Tateyamaria omphalii]|uniref:aminotransferase class IV n=1 Tax=Tateyamaria omphalii TaxID=299262 RepID=UPI0016732250|nr:aminotransferase class IV [Tateyamaria omphalii]GGX38049.1 branched chain amino acid aminotransferase [Tateyamaria omphalii]